MFQYIRLRVRVYALYCNTIYTFSSFSVRPFHILQDVCCKRRFLVQMRGSIRDQQSYRNRGGSVLFYFYFSRIFHCWPKNTGNFFLFHFFFILSYCLVYVLYVLFMYAMHGRHHPNSRNIVPNFDHQLS